MRSNPVAIRVTEGNTPQRTNLRASLQQSGDVVEHRQHDDGSLALRLFSNGIPYEGRRSTAANNVVFSEWRIAVVHLSPVHRQGVVTLGERKGTRIEVELELGFETPIQGRWREPVPTATLDALRQFVWSTFCLMACSHGLRAWVGTATESSHNCFPSHR
jgi:hypothetical protein